MEGIAEAVLLMNQSFTPALPDVLAAVEAAGLFVSLCTIQATTDPEASADAVGQPDEVTWTAVPGMADIPCMMAPGRGGKLPSQDAELDVPSLVLERADFTALLDGYYPQIIPKQRAIVDGAAYDIKDVASDSQGISTWLFLRSALL